MKVYLVDNIKITKFDLPNPTDEFFTYNYLIPNTNIKCLITFEKKNDKWFLKSNGSVNIYRNNSVFDNVEVLPYSTYKLKIIDYNSLVSICFTTFENIQEYKLDLSNITNITIGSNQKCNVCYYNDEIAPAHAGISKVQNSWILSSIEDLKYGTYVNNYRVLKKKLKAGDTIFINGLKIIWMQKFMIINNPNNKVRVTGVNAYTNGIQLDNSKYSPVSDELQSVKLYSEEDYFYHTPRINEVLDEVVVNLDQPPVSEIKEDQPLWMTIGSSVTMASSAFVMGWNVTNGIISGQGSVASLVPQVLMCGAMVFGSLVMPRVVNSYQKKQMKAKEEKRITKFSSYLDKREKDIVLNMKRQAQILRDNSLSSSVCKSLIGNTSNRNFWGREIEDDDFLEIHLGMGNIENTVKINGPESDKFFMDEDGLLERVFDIEKKYERLSDVPIKVSLTKNEISAFICNDNIKNTYLDNVLLQLVALHSGSDLKIVIFTDESNADRWEYTKYLPHCFSEDKTMRFFATNMEETKEVSAALEEIFKSRHSAIEKNSNEDEDSSKQIKADRGYKNFSTYYLIICDNYKNSSNIPIIKNIMEAELNCGFSFSIFTNTLKNIPSRCKTFIEVGQKEGCVIYRNINSKKQEIFSVECDNTLDMRQLCNTLLNIPLIPKEGTQVLPQSLSFLEMYGVSKIEQLNILNRWKINNPVSSLTTPIGVYANGEQFKLNLHEKFHGPHGLIAGSTGSGKSEFIITYILSMCVNYHPYEVQFVLIDYKGGGLAGAFQNKETGVKIPHLVGTITNLDTSEMNRTLVSINSELKRRQKVFNETKDMLGESTVDIYKYQKFYREGAVKEPMAHLFIISDEFAELKAQQPEFMQELISTARIGRSLGVHLILATQKPSGVVNDQIWSNAKFKVCLKVQDRSDSMEMLKRPEAASIKETGRFYLQVGYDDFFDKGQSGWAGAKYIPSDKVIKKIDDSIEFIDNIGNVTRSIKEIVKVQNTSTEEDLGDQLTNIVKTIYTLGKKENIVTKGLWLDSIPEIINVEELKKKYNYKPEPYEINPVIGEYDRPSAQEQGLLNINLTKGNLMIWGQAGSGKESLLTTLIWSTCVEHTPQEVNIYIVDCGSESLSRFNKMPHVGDVATIADQEKTFNMMLMVEEEIESRKELMVDYGGSYKEYIENSGKKLPLIMIVINNYEVFTENFGKLSEEIQTFYRDGAKYGIVFVVSAIATNAVKNKMLQNFVNKICLQIPQASDYRSIINADRGLVPSKLFGRGLVELSFGTVEFQTGIFCDKKVLSTYISSVSKHLMDAYKYKAKPILVMPEVVTKESISSTNINLSTIPVGIGMEKIEEVTYDFTQNTITNILANQLSQPELSFVKIFLDYAHDISDLQVNVLDLYSVFKALYEGKDENYYCANFDQAIININNQIMQNQKEKIKSITFILGAGEIKKKLTANGIAVLNNLFDKLPSFEDTYFVFVDTYSSIKNIQAEIWYQNNIDNTSGIWLGEGVANQMAININDLSRDHKGLNFPYLAFVVTSGNYSIIKHISEGGQ